MSLKMYLSNFKQNLYLTISVSVSLFLFLVVALYMDFDYATYENGTKRIPRNCIWIESSSKEVLDNIMDKIPQKKSLICKNCIAGTVIEGEDSVEVNVDYNVICVNRVPDNIFIHSSLEKFGNEDISNTYNFEKYEMLVGRSNFQSEKEVVISESHANRLASDLNDVLGMQIFMGKNGVLNAYTVIGVYKDVLTECKLNKRVYQELSEIGKSEYKKSLDNSIVNTLFVSDNAFDDKEIDSWDMYLYYDDEEEYEDYISKLLQMSGETSFANKFEYKTSKKIEVFNKYEWSANLQIKALLMFIIALISGISVFGTMVNSVDKQRKEIGIKKALGASDGDVMAGFVIENIINSLVAIIFSLILVSIVFICYTYHQRQIEMINYTIRFYLFTIVLFLCYSFSVVIGFSLIPAYTATQVNIIDTLRDE